MAIYSAGRRRTMIILLLTSVLLITLDLRGNAVFNAARSGFTYALRPFEIAGEVVTRPVTRLWNGMTEVDDLEAENRLLQQQLDAQRSDQIAAQNALIENRELRALLDLESLASFDRVTASIIGSSPSNFDQRVEIDRGFTDGIRVGMPVINSAGLVGKITNVFPEGAIVMLVTDAQYHVPVKVVAEVFPGPSTTVPATVPSGIPVEDVTTTTSSTTTTTTSTTSTTAPTSVDGGSGDGSTGGTGGDSSIPPVGATTTSSTTTTTLLEPIEVTRETGELNGLGADRLPRVRFIADSPQFGRIAVGDAVLTAGGSLSLAPPNIPIGKVANVIPRPGSAGLELEVELNADLDRLNFLTIVLYVSPTEAPALGR
jgi:rod shape-determining protein MreC